MHEHSKNNNKATKTIFKDQTKILELKNTITELTNALKEIKSTLDWAEERISELADSSLGIIESEEQENK